jgi:hypothetical protein
MLLQVHEIQPKNVPDVRECVTLCGTDSVEPVPCRHVLQEARKTKCMACTRTQTSSPSI